MNYDNKRIVSKNNAMQVLKSNFFKCFFMTTIILLPYWLLNSISNYVCFMSQNIDELTMYTVASLLVFIINPAIMMWLLAPLNFGLIRAFEKLTLKKSVEITDIFYYSQSVDRKKWCYSLIFKVFFRLLYIYIGVIICLCFILGGSIYVLYQDFYGLPLSDIIVFPMVLATFIIFPLYARAFTKQISLELSYYECIFTNSDDINSVLKTRMAEYKTKQTDVFTFGFSFLWFYIASIALSFYTLGISSILYSMYKTMCMIYYAKFNIEDDTKSNYFNDMLI